MASERKRAIGEEAEKNKCVPTSPGSPAAPAQRHAGGGNLRVWIGSATVIHQKEKKSSHESYMIWQRLFLDVGGGNLEGNVENAKHLKALEDPAKNRRKGEESKKE